MLRKEDDAVLIREYKHDLKEQLAKAKDLDAKLQKLKAERVDGKDAILTMAQFIELFQNVANSLRKVDGMADLDYLMRKLFMNFTVKDRKVADITQNSPFRELCLVASSAMVTLPGIEPGFKA